MIVELEKENVEYIKRAARDDRIACPARLLVSTAAASIAARPLSRWATSPTAIYTVRKSWNSAPVCCQGLDACTHRSPSDRSLRSRRQRVRCCEALDVADGVQHGRSAAIVVGSTPLRRLLRQVKRELLLLAAVHAWWLCLLATPFIVDGSGSPCGLVATLGLAPFAVMSARCRSISLGIYSVTAWNVYALGIWPGLLQRRVDPAEWIKSTTIREPASVLERVEAPNKDALPVTFTRRGPVNVIHNKTNYVRTNRVPDKETGRVRRKWRNAW